MFNKSKSGLNPAYPKISPFEGKGNPHLYGFLIPSID